ncbi:MAG: serine/threonine protein kinase, partial [Planctomycetota bacterium]
SSDLTPYLVMEFVRGQPIDRWCDERRLGVPERLRLFATLCRALHFAHQNLIVHGDVKPGNVLVGEDGLVKVVDFGIARLLDPGAGATLADVTRTLTRILTPEYASPEQLRGAALTTAADVYSLGVLLYVLLTGSKPMRSDGLTPGEWERLVAEKEPTRPSNAISSATVGATARALRGDLDRIVLMALRKEPARRYESALQFAEDLERHMRGLPVQARDDTLAYRTWTFVRRNRLAVGAALLVFLALVVGLVVALRAEQRARAEGEHARVEADSFREIAEASLEALLPAAQEPVSPEQARAVLLRRADQVRRQYAALHHLRANLLDAIGRLLLALGAGADADALVREALAIREHEFGARSLEVALSLRSLAEVQEQRAELGPAVQSLERALELHRSIRGVHTDVAMAANDLGVALRKRGRLDEAARLHEEALALRRAEPGGGRTLAVAECLADLAAVCGERGDSARAGELLDEAIAIRAEILGAEHPLTLRTKAAPDLR